MKKLKIKVSYEELDNIIVQGLIEQLDSLEYSPDEFETPDNIALDIAAIYTVLKIFMPHTDYKKFVKDRTL